MNRRHPRMKALAALGVVVLCAAACDPGWVNPVVGTGDGSGSLPGTVAVANENVALAAPLVISALPGGGLLLYDGASCTIMKVLKATTTRIAGTGTCGHTGDGGPAIDAEIEEAGLGVGLWRNTSGDLFIDTDRGKGIRRIDGQTGVITALPVTVGDQEDIFGGSADPDGSFTYLVDDLGDHSTFTIRRIDANGNDAALFTRSGSILPINLVRTGVDRYVTGDTQFDTSHVLLDIDLSSGVATPRTVDAAGYLEVQAAGPDGVIYGSNPTQIFRIDPGGSAKIIAGTGNADPQTSRQIGDALQLNISQWALTLTENGNLLFASGHVVYDLLDPAHAPGDASTS